MASARSLVEAGITRVALVVFRCVGPHLDELRNDIRIAFGASIEQPSGDIGAFAVVLGHFGSDAQMIGTTQKYPLRNWFSSKILPT